MIVRTGAIVVKSMRYRETSKIITLYTRTFGRISVIAKGARDLKNKFGGSLEPMTHISAVFYKKPHRDLHLLSSTDINEEFRNLHSDFDRMTVGYAVADLLNAVMHDEEENPDVFNLVLETLRCLDSGTKNFRNLFYHYEIRLASLLGFGLVLDRCGICGTPVGDGTRTRLGFNPIQGCIVDENCSRQSDRLMPLSLPSAKILRWLSQATAGGALSVEVSAASEREIESLLRAHFGAHIETTRKVKSLITPRSRSVVINGNEGKT